MSKLIDLTGQKFGRWLVLEKAESKNNKTRWKCQCDCGTIKIVNGTDLKLGKSSSCGCLRKEMTAQKNYQDLTGQTFGLLTVLYQAEERTNCGIIRWHCKCQCGNECDIARTELKSGDTKSCGCLTMSHGELKINQILKENNIDFIQEYHPDTLFKNGRFDFYIPSLKLLIEYDGKQHFQVNGSGWDEPFEIIQKRDSEKNKWALENEFQLIRIPYTHYNDLCLEDLIPETSSFLINKKIKYLSRKRD